ncbi:Uncharacterised protein [Vibrio cholerae]|nr:Uncharacterised protein [Vibrio cholerae]
MCSTSFLCMALCVMERATTRIYNTVSCLVSLKLNLNTPCMI